MENCLVSFILSIVFFALFILFSLIAFFDKNKVKYDFRNSFPYEINKYKLTRDNAFGRVSLILSSLMVIYFLCCYPIGKTGYEFGISIFIAVTGILAAISMIFVVFTPIQNLKNHLIFDILLFVGVLALTFGLGFFALWPLKESLAEIDIKRTLIGVGAIFIVIGLFALILNPKMKQWAMLKEKIAEDGAVTYERPKWFVLAYTEWIFIATIFVDLLLLLTVMF